MNSRTTAAIAVAALVLAVAAILADLTHPAPRPGHGYTAECHQLMNNPSNTGQVTYYYPCSPIPQNTADQ